LILSSESDIVLLNKKGIFVFECKSRKGLKTKLNYPAPDVWRLYKGFDNSGTLDSPIKQNRNHIRALETVLGTNNVFYNIAVSNLEFEYTDGNRKFLSEETPLITLGKQEYLVCIDEMKGNGHKALIQKIKELPEVYSDCEIEMLGEKLKGISDNEELKRLHKEYCKQIKDGI